MRTFYVRPQNDTGYGRSDGTSYDNAWNGLAAVDWSAMSGGEPTQLHPPNGSIGHLARGSARCIPGAASWCCRPSTR